MRIQPILVLFFLAMHGHAQVPTIVRVDYLDDDFTEGFDPECGLFSTVYFPGECHLSDKTSLHPGSGSFSYHCLQFTGADVVDGELRFEFDSISESRIFSFSTAFFDSKFVGAGVFRPYGRFIMTATPGSTTATLTAEMYVAPLITDLPDGIPLEIAAPLGSVATFTSEITILDSTWQLDSFENFFLYEVCGSVDLESYRLIGDMNLDGRVDLLDVAPFVQAILDDNNDLLGDMNGDSLTNLQDVFRFAEILSSG